MFINVSLTDIFLTELKWLHNTFVGHWVTLTDFLDKETST